MQFINLLIEKKVEIIQIQEALALILSVSESQVRIDYDLYTLTFSDAEGEKAIYCDIKKVHGDFELFLDLNVLCEPQKSDFNVNDYYFARKICNILNMNCLTPLNESPNPYLYYLFIPNDNIKHIVKAYDSPEDSADDFPYASSSDNDSLYIEIYERLPDNYLQFNPEVLYAQYQSKVQKKIKLITDLMSRGNHQMVMHKINEIITEYPYSQSGKLYYLLGAEYAQTGEYEKAIQLMTQAMTLDPDLRNEAFFRLESLYLYQRQPGQNWESLLAALPSNDLFWLSSLGLLHLAKNEFSPNNTLLEEWIINNILFTLNAKR